MGGKLILGNSFDLKKIGEEHYQHIVERLLIVTDDFTVNGSIHLYENDFHFADVLDKKTNPAGENHLAILSQTIEAIKAAFGDENIMENQGIFLTLSGRKYLNFHTKPAN